MTMRAPSRYSLTLAGFAAAAAVALAGIGFEGWRFGWTETQALARVERHVREQIDLMVLSLGDRAARIADASELIVRARSDSHSLRLLFDRLDMPFAGTDAGMSATVYNVAGTAVAWAGRPTEVSNERLLGPDAVFTAPGPTGLQLVYVRPVLDAVAADDGAMPVRVASVATELPLSSPTLGQRDPSAGYVLDTPLAPVTLRPRFEGAGDRPVAGAFLITALQGEPLIEVQVSAADLVAARARLRARLLSLVLLVLALTLVTRVPAELAERDLARTWQGHVGPVLRLVSTAFASAALVWLADPTIWWIDASADVPRYTAAVLRPVIRSPVDLLAFACAFAALAALGLDLLFRIRRARRTGRRSPATEPFVFLAHQTLAGCALGALLLGFAGWFQLAVDTTTLDITHFSLHPWDSQRLVLMLGLIILHAALLWTGVAACLAASLRWRVAGPTSAWSLAALAAWMTPVVIIYGMARLGDLVVSAEGLLVSGVACALSVSSRRPMMAWYRHSSQVSRLLVSFVSLLGPTLLLYPSAVHQAERTKRALVEDRFAPQTVLHPDRLKQNLDLALSQIDATPLLPQLVAAPDGPEPGSPPTDNAFLLWRSTSLARSRLTSAIELYNRTGRLVGRFSMNFPEISRPRTIRNNDTCDWTTFPEGGPFGSKERRLLHADRAVCDDDGTVVGAVSVDVMLDYGTLPFISSQSPYFELFRTEPRVLRESAPSRDIELVIYGWGGRATYASGAVTWLLDEALFTQLASSRDPLWTTLRHRQADYAVYFTNDRSGVYALGYPLADPLERVVQLVELGTLAAVGYVLFLALGSVVNELARREAHSGRALLREIRESFYRKLFLAFVATSVVPLLILAFVMRSYFANRLRADVEAEAGRTATVVQRVIEESLAAQQRDRESPRAVTDATMVSIGNIIEQDVNIFAGPRLVATSERDLFASGLLPTRTPHEVYRAIALQQQPQFVGEDELGGVRYMLAAAPVRLGGRDAILTVPQTLRQQGIEREIDELDRRVYLAALVFSLLGAALGFSMAERIADPVSRLTRATRRIARGDFDPAVATRSADELEQLVGAFNRMAVDLKDQRAHLERTNRLEAWAEMARQVAHEIKNPLTPIQLSTEHLRRVHADSGAPLGRIFDSCVDSILKQVHLLRQIAAEFSSFASSPIARPSFVAVATLVREVVDPYRPGTEPRVTIETDVPETIPHAFIDRTLVARSLTNLIENALHAMPDGGRLAIVATLVDPCVEITVSDTGRGMDSEALDRVFEPYFSTRAAGTGLGLTIAKRNIELTHGSIAISSLQGEGTTVTVTLPTSAPAITEASTAAPG